MSPTSNAGSSTIQVRRPTAAPAGDTAAPTFTLGKPIAGLTVALREDRAWRSWQLIGDIWAEYLRRDGAEAITVETGGQIGQPGSDDRKQIDDLARTSDAGIVGLGTCGSCTTYTIKDAVAFEEQERPVVAIVCEEFIVHGQNVARHLGHGDLKILVLPYPLEARPEDELRAIADEYYPKMLELLGVSA
jgi:hypothetical protein